jgi:(4S)-4-hydroxy-5-phosphonooxypentane-2,3-dione isomerase
MLKSLRVEAAALALFALEVLGPVMTENAAAQPTQHYVQLVDYEIASAALERFIEALKENGAATIKEAGCLQFDFSQSASNPNQLFIYEVYENEAAVQAHRNSDHFKKYVSATKDMAVNRQIRPMVSVVHYVKPNAGR